MMGARRRTVVGLIGLTLVTATMTVTGQSARAVRSQPKHNKSVHIAWVKVGNPGNPADTEVMAADRTTGYGAVKYRYRIAKYDITNAQYAKFLDAVARTSDPYLLYFPCMDRSACYGTGSGIVRTGSPGDYSYAPQPGRARRPVNYVNLYDSMRFANWVNNGEGHASTETGAYTLTGHSVVPLNGLTIHRNRDAKVFLPSEDEWYKAAYYDPKHKRYFDYPAGTNKPMKCTLPTAKPNHANCDLITAVKNPANPGLPSVSAWFFGDVTNVGAYRNSASPYGTFDQGGNVFQWTQDYTTAVIDQYQAGSNIAPILDLLYAQTGYPYFDVGPCAVVRGTDWGDSGDYNAASARSCDLAADPFETYGIRLASR